MRGELFVLGLSLCAAAAGAGEEARGRFRRIVFDSSVPFASGPPGFAAEGNRAAYASGTTIHIVDLRTGNVLASRELVPDDKTDAPQTDVRVLGMVDGWVYVCVYQFERPLKRPAQPKGRLVFRVGPRRLPERMEVVAVCAERPVVERVLELPPTANVAERLLGKSIVYTDERTLNVVPVYGEGEWLTLDLQDEQDEPRRRPVVRHGEVFCFCRDSVCAYRPGDAGVTRVPFSGTALAPFVSHRRYSVEKTADAIVATGRNQTVCCDLAGRLRWRLPFGRRVATGARGEVCLMTWETIYGLSPEDGRILWRKPVPSNSFFIPSDGVRGFAVLEGRLIVVTGRMLTVLDARTGKVLVDLPFGRKLNRMKWDSRQPWLGMRLAHNVLVVGFEEWVYGIDLTPTADVSEGDRRLDPANAAGQIMELEASPQDRGKRGGLLIEIGRNLEDTPAAAPKVLPVLEEFIGSSAGRVDRHILEAFHWLDDPMVPRAMVRFLRGKKHEGHRGRMMTAMLACHPEADFVRSALLEIARDKTYAIDIREEAAKNLRLLGVGPKVAPAEIELLYGGDHAGTVAEFRRRLREGDAKARAAALKLLKLAPEAVVVALSDELTDLPDLAERKQGIELVRQAKERIAAIGR